MSPKIISKDPFAGANPFPVLQVLETHEAGVTVGTIGMCTRDRISAHTAISWLMTDKRFLKPGENVVNLIMQGHVLTMQRNEVVQRMKGDWVLFVDDDMVWQPGDVATLVETQQKFDLDMVGGLCFQRGAPFQPTLYKKGETGGYHFMESWPEDTAVEVDATGMAFLLIHVRVFDKIMRFNSPEGFPAWGERQSLPAIPFFRWDGEMGEDLRFCEEAKAAGCRIFVDTSVKIGHVGEQIITEENFLRELVFRPPEATEWRRPKNDALSLPTVTREEALERLEAIQKAKHEGQA